MRHPLAFLLFRSVRGRVVRMARRLRDPRYLVGFLVGGGWVLFWISRAFVWGDGDGDFRVQFGIPPEALEAMAVPLGRAIQLGLALMLAVGVTVWWLVPLGRSSLELSEAELHLLLPAPLPRRQVIQYGILRSQPGVAVGAAVMTFFSGPTSILGAVGRFVGLWTVLTVWDLHAKGRGLWLARQQELPAGAAVRRRLVLLGGLVTLWLFLGAGLARLVGEVLATLPEGDIARFQDVEPWLRTVAQTHVAGAWEGPVGWALTPFLWLLAPYFTILLGGAPAAVARAFVLPFLLLLLHHEWVVRSQTRFEEAELAHARRRSRSDDPAARYWRLSERRRTWRPFELGPGRPEVAILWKNLMLVQRIPLRAVLGALAVLVAGVLALSASGWLPPWTIGVLQVGGVLLIVIPPLFTARSLRCDLRNDLVHVEALRPLPVSGWRLFLAEIGAPALVALLQVLAGCALLLGIGTLSAAGLIEAPWAGAAADALGVPMVVVVPLALLALLPLAIGVTFLSTSLENLAALAFPSWVHLGMDKKQAAAKFGQNIVVFLVLSLALLASLAPGLIAVAVALALQLLVWEIPFSGWELPLLGVLAALPTAVVGAGLIRAGGSLWDRLDPSQELLEGRG